MKIVGILLVLCSYVLAEDLYNVRSNVTPLTNKNFQKQINNRRLRDISTVLMYKGVDAQTIAIARKYEEFANEYKRIFRVFYINCESEKELCNTLKPAKYPAIRIYPPLPIPAFDLQFNDTLEMKTLIDNTAPYLPKPEIEILTSSNINSFLEDKPERPKVLLFSNKKTPSFMLKAIAHTFFDTMCVGFVQDTEEALTKKYKVNEYPMLILIRKKGEKPIIYKGEITLNNIFEFLNIYSEKFVTGTIKDKLREEGEKLLKPWLNQDIPELTKDSIADICVNTGKLCVIYLTNKEPDENIKKLLVSIKEKYAAENRFAYMWLNTELEKAFFDMFQLELSELPKLVILNAGSIKRTLIHQGNMTEESIQTTFDAILNADARFSRLNIKSLPELTQREVIPKTDLQFTS